MENEVIYSLSNGEFKEDDGKIKGYTPFKYHLKFYQNLKIIPQVLKKL